MRYVTHLLMLVTLVAGSCHSGAPDHSAAGNDSGRGGVAGNAVGGGVRADSVAFPKDFVALKRYFVDAKGQAKSDADEVPLSLMKHFLGEELDTLAGESVHPLHLVKNPSGYFFIVREDCSAGAQCEEYRMMKFSSVGEYIENTDLGQVAVDEGGGRYFEYKLLGDSAVSCVDKYEDEDENKADSIVRRVVMLR